MANGILDMFGTNFDDPRTQGLLGLSLGLMEAGGWQDRPTTLGQALARGGQMGMQYRQAALQAQAQKEQQAREATLQDLRMKQLQQQMAQSRAEEARKVQARQAATSLVTGGLPMEELTPEKQRLAAAAGAMPTTIIEKELERQYAQPKQPGLPTIGNVIEMPLEGGFIQKMQYGPLPGGGGFGYQPFGVPFKKAETTSPAALQPRTETIIDPETKQPVKQSVAYLKPGDPRIAQLGGNPTTGRVVLQANVPEEAGKTALIRLADAIHGPEPSLEKTAWLKNQAESMARGVPKQSGIVIGEDGRRVGEAVFDPSPEPGEPNYTVIDRNTGKKRQLLEGETFLGKDAIGILPIGQRNDLEKKLVQGKQGIRKLTSYMDNVSQAKVGGGRIVDEFITLGKTFFNELLPKDMRDLSPSQLALAISKGQLQGLIGASRLQVVGGGVMTEQDALRVIEYLGANVDALQNPEVVAAAIRKVLKEKAEDYNVDARQFNDDTAFRGFKSDFYEYIDIDKLLNSVGVIEATPATGDGSAAANRFEGMSLTDLRGIDVNTLSNDEIIAFQKVLEKVLGK